MRALPLRLAPLALLLAAGARAGEAQAGPPPIADFARHFRYSDARLSTGGTTLAAVDSQGDGRSLAFVDLASHRLTRSEAMPGEAMVGSFHWVNDTRVVVELMDQDGVLTQPMIRGELYALDSSGRGGRLVFGYRAGEKQVGSHLRRPEPEAAWGWVLDTLRDDPRRVLVEAQSMGDVGDRRSRLYLLDVYTGLRSLVTVGPIPEARFLTDEGGEPRLAVGEEAETLEPRYFLREAGGRWRPLAFPASLRGLGDPAPVGLASAERLLYVSGVDAEGFGLWAVGLDDGQARLLLRDADVPPSGLFFAEKTGRLVAVELEPDLPAYRLLEPEHPVARVLAHLARAHPHHRVRLLNTTADDRKVAALLYSDRDPGRVLVVDPETLQAEPVLEVAPWIDPAAMAPVTPFQLRASDGLRLHGYLTRPRGLAPGAPPPPLVVLPHGGPHGTRDRWTFDPEVQLLASRGFAVLQVNFRGSSGYGRAFREAGLGRWGDRVVDDVLEATRHAVREGWADPARICIFGSSFGGYAALQAAARAPELFRCAAGCAGAYDLRLLRRNGDAVASPRAQSLLRKAVGDDRQALQASPVQQAGRIRAKVLLFHGKKDLRAPIEHAYRMQAALAAAGNPPVLVEEPREGHGFYDEAARERMYRRLLDFLGENTGPRTAEAAAASAAAPAP